MIVTKKIKGIKRNKFRSFDVNKGNNRNQFNRISNSKSHQLIDIVDQS